MKARDVMTDQVVTVRADTPIQDIARLLLAKRISAVPVLDEADALVGIVSEEDLIGSDEADWEERRDKWLARLAEGEPLGAEFLSSLRGHAAGHVMSKPVVTIVEDTEVGEIARIFQESRIKRVPVVRNGKIVGVVSRADLLRAMTAQTPSPGGSRFKS
jgi:CBS domain-containing protein